MNTDNTKKKRCLVQRRSSAFVLADAFVGLRLVLGLKGKRISRR